MCAFAPSLVGCNTGTACECTSTWSVHDFVTIYIEIVCNSVGSLTLSCRLPYFTYQSYHSFAQMVQYPYRYPYPSQLLHQIQHGPYLTHTAPRACVRAAPAAADLMHAEGEAARGGTRKARPPRHAARALELVKPAHLAPGGRGIAQVAAHIICTARAQAQQRAARRPGATQQRGRRGTDAEVRRRALPATGS